MGNDRKRGRRGTDKGKGIGAILPGLPGDSSRAVIKVFLDDEWVLPDGWIHVRTPLEAIEILKTGSVTEISLDHDLGDDAGGTGYDVILWIEAAVATQDFVPPKMTVHSANPSASQKMEEGIRSICRIYEEGHTR
jgi:hypothetical protein